MVNTEFAPYYDDYDEKKNYHKVLFKPRVGVQVRELNQMQTMLQKQIERLGDHVFKNGSMVAPGETNYDFNYEYATLGNINYGSVSEILLTNSVTVVGNTSGVVANIVQHVANTQSDPVTVYLKYESSGTAGESRFINGEPVTLSYNNTDFATANIITTGQGSVFTIEAGIFYFNGDFIRTDAQRALLSKYTSTPSVVVGFRLIESVVDSTVDGSLVDVGNKNAVGADRLKKVLTLEVRGIDEVFDRETFIELAQFRDGVFLSKVDNPEYNILADTMARRTYDESGDYTVEAFNINLREHLSADGNGGLYPAPTGKAEKFVVGVEPGKAYVRGYEVENFATRYIDVDKARDTGFINNSGFSVIVGNYVVVDTMNIVPRSNTYQQVTFYSGLPASAGSIPAGTVLGTARLRYVQLSAVAGQALVYLFDVKSAAGTTDTSFVVNAKSMYMAGSPAFTANVKSELIGSVNHGMIFNLPINNVKTLLESGESDTSFSVIRQFSMSADSSGVVVLTAGTNERFATPTGTNAVASYVLSGTATTREIASIATLGGVPVGSTMTLNFGASVAGQTVTINCEVIKQQAIQKTKTKAVGSVTRTTAQVVAGKAVLDKADVYKLTSVTQGGVDITSKFSLKRNINQEYYGVSYVQLNAGEAAPTADIVISFEYFIHGAGDFFSVDSYSSIDYKDIPSETINNVSVSMSDVLDFRPRMNDAGTGFTGTGTSVTEVPAATGLLRCDISHYLPRVDKVYVDSKGVFGVVKGVPALTPSEPEVPDNTMVLYKLVVPAYTRKVADVQAIFVNNRRYTMRDIGKLEDRIANIEYYTTLSLLENETNAMQIVDGTTGLNRFKNGFVTDPFTDYTVANSDVADFKASVGDGILQPELGAGFINLKLDEAYSTGVVKTGSLVTLPFTERTFLSQLLASDSLNVNPYAVYRWNGTLTLNPSSDVWFDSTVVKTTQVSKTVGTWANTTPQTTYVSYLNGVPTYSTDGSVAAAHDVQGQAITNTTTNVVTTTSNTTTTQVGTSDIPYMRSRDVAFTAKGLMPYSRCHAFFDDVNVNAYCKSGSQAFGAAMFADVDGNISGVFRIPNTTAVRFRTGTKQFTLIDASDNVRETSLSYAGASYTAKGTLTQLSKTVVTTSTISQTTDTRVVPWDPLAQSFFVEKSGGVFITSIEVFFKTKDKVMPVSIQIRDMEAGVPGKNIIPYSMVTLNPNQVNTSVNGTVATKFVMESPVYLADGNEYCFVLMSNSNNYEAFIATMGRPALDTKTAISKQPFIGVLFKSQNNSTWTEDQSSDMKFRINTAKFTTDTAFNAGLVFEAPPVVQLSNNPLSSASGTNTITAVIPNHGFVVGSKFTLSGVDVGPGIPLAQLNAVQTVFSINDPDTITFKTTGNATASGSFGGSAVVSERNVAVNNLLPIVQSLLFNQTDIAWKYRGVTSTSLNGSESAYLQGSEYNITPGANNLLPVIHSVPNATDAADKLTVPSGIITGSMVSFVDSISPVIDLNRMGVICISNRINNPAVLNETSATGGNAAARYLTKVIGLKNAANSLKLYVDVNQPQEASVQVMYRTGNTEQEVNDKAWAVMTPVTTSISPDVFTYKEFEYSKDNIALFSFYQFKLVMTSPISGKVPMFKRLRGIALGT